MDHGGQLLTLSYEPWPPVLPVYPDGSFDGIMPRIARSIEKSYNLTIQYQRVSDPNGGKLPNGTWSGDLSDIQTGKIDGSLWGWTPTLDRSEVVDFTHAVVPYYLGLVIAKPNGEEISLQNYIGELRPNSWLLVLGMYLLFFNILVLLQFWNSLSNGRQSNFSLILSSADALFRLVINKVKYIHLL